MKIRGKKLRDQTFSEKKTGVRPFNHQSDQRIFVTEWEERSIFAHTPPEPLTTLESPVLKIAQLEIYEDCPPDQTRSHVYRDLGPASVPDPLPKNITPPPVGSPSHPSACDHCPSNSICSNIKMGLMFLDSACSSIEKSPELGALSRHFEESKTSAKDSLSGHKSSPQKLYCGLLTKLDFYGWNYPLTRHFCSLHLSPKALHAIADQIIGLCRQARIQLSPQVRVLSKRASQIEFHQASKKWKEKIAHLYEEETHHE